MSKILFTHSYFYKFDPKQWKFKQPYPPLGTILAAAVARKNSYDVSLFDTNLVEDPLEIVAKLHAEKPKFVVIYDDGFNYLTKMCLTNMREAAFVMTRESKKTGCIVIASSSDSADHYEKYIDQGVDYVVRGEGEETLMELIQMLETGGDVSNVKGIAFKKDGAVVLTPGRPVMRDLDSLPLPAWDLVDIEPYREIWMKHHGYFSLNVATTRGCPFKCNWCAKPLYGNRYVSRSPQHVVDELEQLLREYNPDHVWMCDDIFGLKPGWVAEFNSLVNQRQLKFRYKIQSRADLLLEENYLEALASSGAETVWIGAESGSQKVLDAMDKGTTIEQIDEATRLLKSNKIRVAYFLQFGYLGEMKADIDATIQMVLRNMPDEIGISVSYPLPGTKFYDKVRDQLVAKQNWNDSDDLDMMFAGTYSKDYYKLLHRYVHSVYRKRRGYNSLKKLLGSPLRLTYNDLRSGLATLYFIPVSFARQIRLRQLESV